MSGLIVAGKDIRSSFVSPLAYVVITGFMLLACFFFFSLLQQFNAVLYQASMMPDSSPSLNEWVITPYYQTMEIVLIFLVPILTMSSFAEERRRGTFELLATSPVSTAGLVLGKFLGVATVVGVMLLTSLIYPIALILLADPEVAPIFVGFLGLLLFALALSAIGVGISALTSSQTVSGVVGLVSMLLLYVADAPAARLSGPLADILGYLSPSTHTEAFIKGVIESGAVVYFLSLVLFGLFLAARALDAARLKLS